MTEMGSLETKNALPPERPLPQVVEIQRSQFIVILDGETRRTFHCAQGEFNAAETHPSNYFPLYWKIKTNQFQILAQFLWVEYNGIRTILYEVLEENELF